MSHLPALPLYLLVDPLFHTTQALPLHPHSYSPLWTHYARYMTVPCCPSASAICDCEPASRDLTSPSSVSWSHSHLWTNYTSNILKSSGCHQLHFQSYIKSSVLDQKKRRRKKCPLQVIYIDLPCGCMQKSKQNNCECLLAHKFKNKTNLKPKHVSVSPVNATFCFIFFSFFFFSRLLWHCHLVKAQQLWKDWK